MRKWILALILLPSVALGEGASYKKLSDQCMSCNKIDNLVIAHNSETSLTSA